MRFPAPRRDLDGPLQMLVTNLDWSDYVGRIAVGRIYSGTLNRAQSVALMQADDQSLAVRAAEVHVYDKLGRVQVDRATAGDIVAVVGIDEVSIGDTLSDPEVRRALPRVEVDEPTIQMVFGINTSPLAGRDGKYVTTRPPGRST